MKLFSGKFFDIFTSLYLMKTVISGMEADGVNTGASRFQSAEEGVVVDDEGVEGTLSVSMGGGRDKFNGGNIGLIEPSIKQMEEVF